MTEQTGEPVLTIPGELKGKLYDKDGNVLEQFPENGEAFNQNGERLKFSVMTYEDKTRDIITNVLIYEDGNGDEQLIKIAEYIPR